MPQRLPFRRFLPIRQSRSLASGLTWCCSRARAAVSRAGSGTLLAGDCGSDGFYWLVGPWIGIRSVGSVGLGREAAMRRRV